MRLKPTTDEEGLHIEDTQQRTPLLPQPRASDRRLGHVPTSLALEIGAESCEFLFLRWEMSGQLSISIPGKFRENKGLGKSHSTLTQGPGLPRRTSGLSSEPFNRRLLQSILHMPGGGAVPTSQSHPFPTWAADAAPSLPDSLPLLRPGWAGSGHARGLSSARLPGADTHRLGTLRLHHSPSPWGRPTHTAPHLQTAPWRPALQPGPAENQTKQVRLCPSQPLSPLHALSLHWAPDS